MGGSSDAAAQYPITPCAPHAGWSTASAFCLTRKGLSRGEVTKALSAKELGGLFDLDYHFEHIATIFRPVFGPA